MITSQNKEKNEEVKVSDLTSLTKIARISVKFLYNVFGKVV